MKKKTKIILAACAGVCVLAAGGALLVLLKIRAAGGMNYLYNSKHPTRGDLPPVVYEHADEGAMALPKASESTLPSLLGIEQKLRYEKDGEMVIESNKKDFYREEPVEFTRDRMLGSIDGIFTFRGNYTRSLSSYGTAVISKEKLVRDFWTFRTGRLLKSNGKDYWTGNGWTGQPLIVRWPEETKRIMNLYPEKKEKADFVEVIYSGMDGYIHFLDLDDGTPSRDPIHIGMVFKGTASLYPTGIPMIVLGSGDAQPGMYGENVSARAYIYSLIDGSKLYEFGMNDSMAPRVFHAFDSSPVFDAKTDTLIYPAENGILYTMKLNTQYDPVAGTLSIAPDHRTDFTYIAAGTAEEDWGMENSATIFSSYLYVGDNGGVFYCFDVNRMEMVWAQDLQSDVNSTPIFSEEEGGRYIYTATTCTASTVDNHHIGIVTIFKLNAANGNIVWKKEFECHNVDGVEGGILATGVLGKNSLDGRIIYSVSRTPELSSGLLISLDCKTGETIWKQQLSSYGWSSTVTLYTEDGRGYLVQCLANGDVLLLNGADGTILDKLSLNATLEATPAVFGNRIVLGTRDRRIVGITVE